MFVTLNPNPVCIPECMFRCKTGDHLVGVISIESELPAAFTESDERLIGTLANQSRHRPRKTHACMRKPCTN